MRTDTTPSVELQTGDWRLDASYHASPGQQAAKQLARSGKKLDRLDQVCKPGGVYIPSRFKRVFVDDPTHGAPYLTGGSIMQLESQYGAKLLSSRYTENLHKLALTEEMILITCSGEIGNTVYVNANFDGAVGSPDLIRILADAQKIPSGYLYAYLSSSIARELIRQKTYGAVVPHIEAHHVVDLPIPRVGKVREELIHNIIRKAADLRVEASRIKQLAEDKTGQLLQVNLNSIPARKMVLIHESALMDRFEATYHAAQNAAAVFAQSPYPLLTLGDLLNRIFYLGKLHRVFVDDESVGVPLLSISDAQKAKLTSDKYISKKLSRNIDDAILEKGWVLISGVGTPGLVVYTRREMEGLAGTDHLVRLVPNRSIILPGYLYSVLTSSLGQKLLLGSSHGSVQLVLPPEYIVLIKIPVPPLDVQQEVDDLIEQYGEALTQASEIEDRAQMVLNESLGM